MNEQLEKVKAQLQEELKNMSILQVKVSELQVCLQHNDSVLDSKSMYSGCSSVIIREYIPSEKSVYKKTNHPKEGVRCSLCAPHGI